MVRTLIYRAPSVRVFAFFPHTLWCKREQKCFLWTLSGVCTSHFHLLLYDTSQKDKKAWLVWCTGQVVKHCTTTPCLFHPAALLASLNHFPTSVFSTFNLQAPFCTHARPFPNFIVHQFPKLASLRSVKPDRDLPQLCPRKKLTWVLQASALLGVVQHSKQKMVKQEMNNNPTGWKTGS